MGLGHDHILAINPVQTALERWFQSLADSYPALSWMVAHPIFAVISLLVVLALMQILLGWISGGIKHLLLSILKSPYSLVRWLLGKTAVPFGTSSKTKLGRATKGKTQDQITSILKRLDHCQREQDKLLLELKTLLPLTLPEHQSSSDLQDLKPQPDSSVTKITPS